MPGSKKLIDIIDEMNMKEDVTRSMVMKKLKKLHDMIAISSKYVMEEREYVFTILDDLSNINTTQEHIDLHEETKTEKTNNESSGSSGGKSDKGKSKSKAKSNVGSKGTK